MHRRTDGAISRLFIIAFPCTSTYVTCPWSVCLSVCLSVCQEQRGCIFSHSLSVGREQTTSSSACTRRSSLPDDLTISSFASLLVRSTQAASQFLCSDPLYNLHACRHATKGRKEEQTTTKRKGIETNGDSDPQQQQQLGMRYESDQN